MSVDSVFRTRSLGVAAVGLPDQYADGKAAKVWQLYIGDTRKRTEEYKTWIMGLLKRHNVHSILDVACGTGYGISLMFVGVFSFCYILSYCLLTLTDFRCC